MRPQLLSMTDRRDHNLDRAFSITQFFEPFGVYKHVMSEAYPVRRTESDLYEAGIRHYSDGFVSTMFYSPKELSLTWRKE